MGVFWETAAKRITLYGAGTAVLMPTGKTPARGAERGQGHGAAPPSLPRSLTLPYLSGMGPIPERIGKFEVEALIGRGAMGIVYKAKDPFIGRLVALKRISLSDLLPEDQKAEFKERFFIEARAAGGLKHPNIVVIHELGEADGAPYMAMEFVEGGSLAKLMKERGPLPLDETIAITRQVALGLAYAHGKGVIHRDVKPDNILLDKNGRVVITDFGAAHMHSSELTRTGEVLGTPHYMSPEQILGDPADGRSDLFSLGVVFYLLLTGRRPFKGDTITSVCYHIVNSPPEPVPESINVPPEALPVLQKLLAKSKEDRYQTGLDLVEALNTLQSVQSPSSPAPESLTQTWDVATPTPGTQRVPLTQAQPGDVLQARQSGPEQVRPEQVKPHPGPPPARPKSGKGLLIGLGIGAAAIALLFVLIIGVLLVRYFRSTKPEVKPELTQNGTSSAPGDQTSQGTGAPGTSQEPPADAGRTQGNGTTDSTSTQTQSPGRSGTTPDATPRRPSQPPTSSGSGSPSPQVIAATDVIIQEAGQVAALSGRRRFGKAFASLDDQKKRLNDLKASATPADEPAIRRAGAVVTGAERQTVDTLAACAVPIVQNGMTVVTAIVGRRPVDRNAVVAAYAEVYPVIRWKDRLPADQQEKVHEFMRLCRANMTDEDWARAHAIGQGRPFPGQS